MAVVQIEIPAGVIENDKCYSINGTVSDFVSNISVTAGDYITQETLGTITGNGDYSFDLDPTSGLSYVVIEYTDTDAIISVSLNIREECAGTACSECLENIEDPECAGCLVMDIEYYNDSDKMGFAYSNTGYTQKMLIGGDVQRPDFVYPSEDTYLQSSGSSLLHYAEHKGEYEMIIHKAPEYIHAALSLALIHDHCFINGVEYVKSEGNYSPDWKDDSFLAPCITKIEKKAGTLFNYRC